MNGSRNIKSFLSGEIDTVFNFFTLPKHCVTEKCDQKKIQDLETLQLETAQLSNENPMREIVQTNYF